MRGAADRQLPDMYGRPLTTAPARNLLSIGSLKSQLLILKTEIANSSTLDTCEPCITFGV